jgi:hypothetical protein
MDKEWYEIRDLFFGHNYEHQDCLKAIQLAKDCKHPEAVYLYNTLKSAESRPHVVRLLALGDLKAKWYLDLMQSYFRTSFTINDYPFSAALSGNYDLMKKAADANEREAFHRLGLHYFQFNREQSNSYFKIAINLGCKRSMEHFSFPLELNDPLKWKLLFKAGGRFVNSELCRGRMLENPCKEDISQEIPRPF